MDGWWISLCLAVPSGNYDWFLLGGCYLYGWSTVSNCVLDNQASGSIKDAFSHSKHGQFEYFSCKAFVQIILCSLWNFYFLRAACFFQWPNRPHTAFVLTSSWGTDESEKDLKTWDLHGFGTFIDWAITRHKSFQVCKLLEPFGKALLSLKKCLSSLFEDVWAVSWHPVKSPKSVPNLRFCCWIWRQLEQRLRADQRVAGLQKILTLGCCSPKWCGPV